MFVSWTPHSRPRDLAKRLDAEYRVPAPFATSWWWPARYTVQAVATIGAILRRRPKTVLFTNPPFLAGLACLVSTRLVGSQCWADCHSGAYNDPRWMRFARANAAVVRRCDGAVFHNALLAAEQRENVNRSTVLSVYAMSDRVVENDRSCHPQQRPLAVAVCSYGFDEPIDLILEAAARIPQIDIAMTGTPPAGLPSRAPANVQFTGWLSDDAYHNMIADALVVICLTTREATMQNGLVEGLEHRRPVITSNTQALRDWARDVPGVITVDHKADSLAETIAFVVQDNANWAVQASNGQQIALLRAEDELRKLQDAMARV
jgi:glycosyltransferase involved in cell wall biosynthesis